MQSSRFQIGLIALLAGGLGFALSSSNAVGYPAGAAVSYGQNPIVSFGGVANGTDVISLETVADGQTLIVTDVSLIPQSLDPDCMDMIDARLTTADRELATWDVSTRYCYSAACYSDGRAIEQKWVSGIKVEEGESLTLTTNLYNSYTYAGCSGGRSTAVKYTIAGYYAQS